MAERVKVRLSTFLECFIAIATAFVLVEGSGWQKKKSKSESERSDGGRERERLWLAPLSWRGSTNPFLCQPQDPGTSGSQGHWRVKMNNSWMCFCKLHIQEKATKSSSKSHRQREPPLCSEDVQDCPSQDSPSTSRRIMVAWKWPWDVLKGHDEKEGISSLLFCL